MAGLSEISTKWRGYSHPNLFLRNEDVVDEIFKYLFVSTDKIKDLNPHKGIYSIGYSMSVAAITTVVKSDVDNYLDIIEDVPISTVEDFKKGKKNELCENGWEFLDTSAMPMAHYISQKNPTDTVVIRNVAKQHTVIITPSIVEDDRWARILAVIDNLMPWFFDFSKDRDFARLLDNLSHDHSKKHILKIEEIMNAVFDKLNIREQIIRQDFEGFENILKAKLIAEIDTKIENTRYSIQCENEKLDILYSTLAECNLKLQSYKSLEDEGINFVNFIMQHKNIDNIKKLDTNRFAFTIRETIEYYDEDGFKTSYNTPGSIFDKNLDGSDLLYELFVNHRGKIETVSEFECQNLTRLDPVRRGGGSFGNATYNQAMPHPHLAFHACLGGNEKQIRDYLAKGNWDMAIEQAIGATKNINISDHSPMSHLINYIKNYRNEPFIIADNGKRMTVAQFEKYVKGEKKDVKED